MKPTMLKTHDRLISNLALIGILSALLAGCGGPDKADPKSNDVYKPRITLNSPGPDAIVQTDTNSVIIPVENICYEITNECEKVTVNNSGIIYYTDPNLAPNDFIELSGSIIGYSQDHEFGTSFEDPGAVARDVFDGYSPVLTTIHGPVQDTTDNPKLITIGDTLGVYTFTYTSTDSGKNTSTLKRVVNVVDMDPPEVTLAGGSAIILGMGSDFNDPGATATDNWDGEITLADDAISYRRVLSKDVSVEVDEISTDSLAEFEVTYNFEDAAGNAETVTRSVIVAPPEGEIIDIIKDGALGESMTAGITAYDQDLNWNSCTAPGGCPNIDWAFVNDNDLDSDGVPRGDVLEVTHAETLALAGVIIASSGPIDIRSATNGFLKFDLKILQGGSGVTFKTDCGYPCSGADQYHTVAEIGEWETVIVPISKVREGGLDLANIRAALVINGTTVAEDETLTVFRLDNVSFDCRAAECAGIDVPFVPVDWAATHEDPTNPADTTPTSYDGYTLVWSDEFDGNSVNTNNWSFDIGTGDNGWGNGELQYYRPDNASVEDGLLIIEAAKHDPLIDIGDEKIRYTSSKLKTEDLFEFQYGRVDIRAVVAQGQGMWSAGWMLGANHSDIGWPYSGEIDIFDTIGGVKGGVPQEGMYVNNMYWNSTGNNRLTDEYSPGNININDFTAVRINNSNEGTTFSNTFHTFSLIWDKDKIEFLLDNETTHSIDLADGSVLADTFRNPFYLILNVAIGGAWPGSPYDTTNFPDGMLVDYVRVYQVDSDGDGVADD